MFKKEVLKLNGPIVIFGSSGFVGCNLLNQILKYRKDCYAVTHNPRSAWRLKLMNIDSSNILHCDITYKNSVRDLFKEINPKTVFNLSAFGAYSKQNNSNLIFDTNINGTLNILEECNNNIDSTHTIFLVFLFISCCIIFNFFSSFRLSDFWRYLRKLFNMPLNIT